MSKLKFQVSQQKGKIPVTVLHVVGDVDANSHQELDAKAEEILKGGAQHIILDLTENTYMSSAGFRSMHKIYTALQGGGDDTAALKLVNPSAEIRRLMKAMGFDLHFPVYDDLNEAVNAF